ncbi:MAG: PilZ domain-containing protein [Sphingomicrobium sp.]
MEQLPIETTVYSMSSEPPRQSERRSDERHMTLFRVGSILIDGRRELCLVKNISAGGALIRAYCRLQADLNLQIELKEQQPISGTVNWVKGTDAGITFDERVDVVELLKSSGDGPRPRMPRVEVRCLVFVREGATTNRTKLINISQGGMSVESENSLTVGAEVTASLPGLPPQAAVIRWAEGSRYGISFNTVLPLAGLTEWLHGRSGA